MPKLFQIAISANWGSAGKIAEQIGQEVMAHGWESYIAYGRHVNPSSSHLIKVGNSLSLKIHYLGTLFFDRHGLGSVLSTRKLIAEMERIKPDVVQLHNLHGYYINYPILFEYLESRNIPVVWTLHDCWSFTGRCTHFESFGCEKWRTHCCDCPQKRGYAMSPLMDRSASNFDRKRNSFLGLSNLTMVPVSRWLEGLLGDSFFKNSKMRLIQNGIDLAKYKPNGDESVLEKYGINKPYVIGVSSVWGPNKGYNDFFRLRDLLPHDLQVVMVGLTEKQVAEVPEGIIGIKRTESLAELTALYTGALCLVNTTYGDTFPTVNIESLACGTPVVTYRTGGSPEIINEDTGIVVERGDVEELANAVNDVVSRGKNFYSGNCVARAAAQFDKNEKFKAYYSLYCELLNS